MLQFDFNISMTFVVVVVVLLLLLLLLHSPATSLGFIILGEIFAYVTVFSSNHWGSHIPSSWMVHAGCVFVAGIHPSRTWMSGSFESVQWNACVHRLDLGLYSHPKEFWGIGVRTHVSSNGKIPYTRKKFPQRRLEPMLLHQEGQQAQHITSELFQPHDDFFKDLELLKCWNVFDFLLKFQADQTKLIEMAMFIRLICTVINVPGHSALLLLLLLCSPAVSLGSTIFGWDFCVCDCFLIQPLR